MQFTVGSILLALFTGVIGALTSYLAFYAKPKAELRAATEDLKAHISNQVQITRALEEEKLSALETRKCIYSLVTAAYGLAHSMCWLRWDVEQRKAVRQDLADLYNTEAHKFIPEILAQHLILSRLSPEMFLRSQDAVQALIELDAEFGQAIVESTGNQTQAVGRISQLFERSQEVETRLTKAFIGATR